MTPEHSEEWKIQAFVFHLYQHKGLDCTSRGGNVSLTNMLNLFQRGGFVSVSSDLLSWMKLGIPSTLILHDFPVSA